MERLRVALLNKIFNPPIPPLVKGGERGLFTKWGLGGITGLSLVEVMIALVIVLLVFLALMQTALVSIESNTVNILRDEAVSIAEMRMNEARNIPFASLISDAASVPVTRNVKNITGGFIFNTLMTVTELGGDGSLATDDADNRQVNIIVTWEWKDKTVANSDPYTHSITTIRRRT